MSTATRMLILLVAVLAVLVEVSTAAITSCDCNRNPEDFWFGWDCLACTCPPKLPASNSTTTSVYSGECANDVCSSGQYVCCTEDQSFPDLSQANRDESCGRLLYFPYVVACNAWSCVTYSGCGSAHQVEVSGCGCGCHKAGLTGWEIALIVIAAIFGAFLLGILGWQLLLCWRRRRGVASLSSPSSTTARFGDAAQQRSRASTQRQPPASVEMTEAPAIGVPVWMDTSGAMLSGGIMQQQQQQQQQQQGGNPPPPAFCAPTPGRVVVPPPTTG